MTALIIVGVVAYVVLHIGAGHARHRRAKSRGLSPNLYWSAARGPYGSIRVGGFRIGHKL